VEVVDHAMAGENPPRRRWRGLEAARRESGGAARTWGASGGMRARERERTRRACGEGLGRVEFDPSPTDRAGHLGQANWVRLDQLGSNYLSIFLEQFFK
jgi:hypothetical protein